MLEVRNLSIKLGGFSLSDVSFDVAEGEYFVILGASGVGKSVLLEIIAGLTPPDRGSVLFRGRDITRESMQKRDIGMVFQNGALFPHMSVRANVAYGMESRKVTGKEKGRRVEELAERLGFLGHLGRKPSTLSGGEVQRVALARTLAKEPGCLLLDEPLSSLDSGARSGLRAILRELNRGGMTTLHVTHDYEEALSLADRIAVMENGTVIQVDTPENVFRRPASGFVADFVGIRNYFKGRLLKPEGQNGDVRGFVSEGVRFFLLSTADRGEGSVIIRSEDVTLSAGNVSTSARNSFPGVVTDLFPVRMGIEVIVDIGVDIAALVTRGSARKLGLQPGRKVYVSIKAGAIKYLE